MSAVKVDFLEQFRIALRTKDYQYCRMELAAHDAEIANAAETKWILLMGEFRQALNEANLHGHYNLFQQFFGEDMTRKLDEAGTHIDNAAAKKALTAAERSARLEELLSEVDGCSTCSTCKGKIAALLDAKPSQDTKV